VTNFIHRAEDLLLAAVLALLVVLGSASASMRFSNFDELIRHLTLLVGMLGGMVAAREGRLLAMGTFLQGVSPKWQSTVQVFTTGVANCCASENPRTTQATLTICTAFGFLNAFATFEDSLTFSVDVPGFTGVVSLPTDRLSLSFFAVALSSVSVSVALAFSLVVSATATASFLLASLSAIAGAVVSFGAGGGGDGGGGGGGGGEGRAGGETVIFSVASSDAKKSSSAQKESVSGPE